MSYTRLRKQMVRLQSEGHTGPAMAALLCLLFSGFFSPTVASGAETLRLLYMPAFTKSLINAGTAQLYPEHEKQISEEDLRRLSGEIKSSRFEVTLVPLEKKDFEKWEYERWSEATPAEQETSLRNWCISYDVEGVAGYWLELSSSFPVVRAYLYLHEHQIESAGFPMHFSFFPRQLPLGITSLEGVRTSQWSEVAKGISNLVNSIQQPAPLAEQSTPPVPTIAPRATPPHPPAPAAASATPPTTPRTSPPVTATTGRGQHSNDKKRVAILNFSKEFINDQSTIAKAHRFINKDKALRDIIKDGVEKALAGELPGDYFSVPDRNVSYVFIESPSFSIGTDPRARENALAGICNENDADDLAFGHFKEEFSPDDGDLAVFLVVRLFDCDQETISTHRDKLQTSQSAFAEQVEALFSQFRLKPPEKPTPPTSVVKTASVFIVSGDTMYKLIERCYGEMTQREKDAICDEIVSHNSELAACNSTLHENSLIRFPQRVGDKAILNEDQCKNRRYLYTVRAGDNLSKISRNCYGNGDDKYWNQIVRLNQIRDTRIQEDRKLMIPQLLFDLELLPESRRKDCTLQDFPGNN